VSDKQPTEYAIKQVGGHYYPVIIDREAGGHYEIKNPLTGGVLSYKNVKAAEIYLHRKGPSEGVRIGLLLAKVIWPYVFGPLEMRNSTASP
jgi:hypothetical protein